MAHPQHGLNAAEVRSLVEEHYDDVFAYCRRHTDSADEAQDATQEVFLRFMRAAKGYRDAGKPLAYLLTIARNICVDAARVRARATEELPADGMLASSEPLSPEIFGPDDAAGLRHALTSMPSGAREVLELRFDQELTFSEIAMVMGISRFAARRSSMLRSMNFGRNWCQERRVCYEGEAGKRAREAALGSVSL